MSLHYGKRYGLKCDPLMYRFIALLPTLSKGAEAKIKNRLLGHFKENNVITERQAAYLKGDSTIQQLLYIIDLIRKSWTKGCITQGIFFAMFLRLSISVGIKGF